MFPTLAQGCAMCGTAAGDAADPLARSLSISTLFMVSMPFVLFVSVGGWFLVRHLRSRRSEIDATVIAIQESAP